MRARWVKNVPEVVADAPQNIGYTIIASRWPWKYYVVMTVEGTTNVPSTTAVFRGLDETGGCVGASLYEQEYANRDDAEKGHKEIVELIAAGRLKL